MNLTRNAIPRRAFWTGDCGSLGSSQGLRFVPGSLFIAALRAWQRVSRTRVFQTPLPGHPWTRVWVMVFALAGSLHAEKWKSLDGKVIHGDFVRLENGVVVLRVNDKEYNVPQEKLDPASIGLARSLNESLEQQADATKDGTIIDESLLVRLVAHSPGKLEGIHCLLSGHVVSVTRPAGSSLLSSSKEKEKTMVAANDKVDVTFSGGTKATLDFSKEVAKSVNPTFKHNARVEIEGNSAKLMTIDGFMAKQPKWITKDILIAQGQEFIMRARVKNGEIICGDQASSQEINMARSLHNRKPGSAAPENRPLRPVSPHKQPERLVE